MAGPHDRPVLISIVRPLTAATLKLVCGPARAEIASRGAELRAWSVGGTPLLWEKDAVYWDETAPILFPVVGWTRGGEARVAGKSFPLGLHGFARTMNFSAAAVTPTQARLSLSSSAESLMLYPFAFRLRVDYRLTEDSLSATLTVKNCGSGPMPYACGLHPGFRWPFAGGARSDYSIQFTEPEEASAPEISKQGLFLETRREIPLNGRRLALEPGLFAAEALRFLNASSRSLRFGREGGAGIAVETANSRISPCGRGRAPNSSRSNAGPATATRKALTATSLRNHRCAYWSRAPWPATSRAIPLFAPRLQLCGKLRYGAFGRSRREEA